MKRGLVSIAMGVGLLSGLLPSAALAAGGSSATTATTASALSALSALPFGTLQPGRTVTYTQRVPINIVLLGFKPGQINRHELLANLPSSSKPATRDWLKYGLKGRDLGLRYDYDYHVSNASSDVTDRYFAYLRASATFVIHPTIFQQAYNAQAHHVLDVTGPVLVDDGPAAEEWLEHNLDVPSKGYTLVFVNWYARPDFQFHLYTKNDEPDPDTGFNFGLTQQNGLLTAWGGSHGRLWFYDLSAGPDWNSGNYDQDDADFNGDGIPEYRIPPIWEYTPGGYRDPSALSSDLGLVTRYVGLDELFTSSPYYDPLATAPGPGGSKVVQVNMFEDDPATSGTDSMKLSIVSSALAALEPYYNWKTNLIDRNPIDPDALKAWRIQAASITADDCWNTYHTTDAELYCYFTAHASQYLPSGQPNDYVSNVLALNTTDAAVANVAYLGSAWDTFVDGRQTIIQEFLPTFWRAISGGTQTTIHEAGHLVAGLGHPHDGYDPASGRFIDPENDLDFVWLGDASETVMNYLYDTHAFGQFDQDNVHRWETAGYLNWSNSLLGKILAQPGALKYVPDLVRADVDATKALAAFGRWDFLTSATGARQVYVEIQTIATRLKVALPASQVAGLAPSTARASEATPALNDTPDVTGKPAITDTPGLTDSFRVPVDLAPIDPIKPTP